MKNLTLLILMVFITPPCLAVIGSEATNDFPEFAHTTVMLQWFGDKYCTATLIAPRVLLTAAHCLVGKSPDFMRANFQNEPYGLRDIQAGIVHEKFVMGTSHCKDSESCSLEDRIKTDTSTNDIALLLLKETAPEGAQVMPFAKSPQSKTVLPARIAGYGESYFLSSAPFQAYFSVGDLNLLNEFKKILVQNTKESSLCGGDSGGPIVVRDDQGKLLQIGVASYIFFPDPNLYCQYRYGIYTDVSSYADWIQQNIAKLQMPSEKAKNIKVPSGLVKPTVRIKNTNRG